MSQIMPFLMGRFEPDNSHDKNNQNSMKNPSNNDNIHFDKSSEFKPILNNTKNEYGFFKRLDSHRSTTTSTTIAPTIRRFI